MIAALFALFLVLGVTVLGLIWFLIEVFIFVEFTKEAEKSDE